MDLPLLSFFPTFDFLVVESLLLFSCVVVRSAPHTQLLLSAITKAGCIPASGAKKHRMQLSQLLKRRKPSQRIGCSAASDAARHQMQALVNAKPLHPHMCDAKMQLALVIALSVAILALVLLLSDDAR